MEIGELDLNGTHLTNWAQVFGGVFVLRLTDTLGTALTTSAGGSVPAGAKHYTGTLQSAQVGSFFGQKTDVDVYQFPGSIYIERSVSGGTQTASLTSMGANAENHSGTRYWTVRSSNSSGPGAGGSCVLLVLE